MSECLQRPSSCSRRDVVIRHELQLIKLGGASIKAPCATSMATKFSSMPPLGSSLTQSWGCTSVRLFMLRKVPSDCSSENGVQIYEHTSLVMFLCHAKYLLSCSLSAWNGMLLLFNLCLHMSMPSLKVIAAGITRL